MEPYWYGGPRGSTSGNSQQYGYYNYGVSLVTSGSVQGPHLAHPQPVSSDWGKKYVYSLRVINPKRKSLFEMKKFTSESRFQFPGELRSHIKEEFTTVVPESDNFSLGYYQKGRGNSKIFLINENDMDTMYTQYAEAQEIQLWCDGRCDKLDNTDSVEPPKKRSRQDTCNSKRSAIQEEVEEIHLKLKEKHADKYTPAQLRLWANMLQIGTHKDYNMPPDVPMFGGGKKRYEKHSEVVDALSGIAEGIVRALKPHSGTQSPTHASVSSQSTTCVGVSPGKQVQLRGQLITQIKQLHELLEAGAISLEEYNSQKAPTLEKLHSL